MLFKKSLTHILNIYHFDIFNYSDKLSLQAKRFFIVLSLLLPPIMILLGFLVIGPDLNNFSYTFANFSESPEISIEGSRGAIILLFGLMFAHQIVSAALAPIDLLVRARHENKPVAWEDCFVFSIASALIGMTAVLSLITPIGNWLVGMVTLFLNAFNNIEPIVTLPFIWLAIIIYILDDVFFYIGHRCAHNIRVIWKLGHLQHHRPTNLTSATSVGDSPAFFLDGGAGSFVTNIFGKAIFFKLFSEVDTSSALGAAFLIASLKIINHTVSHSYSAYLLFSKYKLLAMLERVFVTGRIHYVHHSKLPQHNIASGCNFAAQFVWIDKFLGTYAEPTHEIPATGLFHEPMPPGNPIKFAFDQWIKLGRELYFNSPKYWLKILFADPSYEPPNPAYPIKNFAV